MSNYPPGVTGYEPEIAGYEEVALLVDCENEAMPTISRSAVLDVLGLYEQSENPARTKAIEDLRAHEVPCEYSGYVTGYIVGDSVEWDCPRCGETHIEYP